MLLRSVEITDFLSVKGSTKLLLDRAITVLLGSNDHGKSNLLKAIEHLNDDRPITADEVNWDATGIATLDFAFRLSDSEKAAWSTAVKALREEIAEGEEEASDEESEDEDKAKTAEASTAEATPPANPADPAAAQAPAKEAARKAAARQKAEETREREIREFLAQTADDLAPEELLLSRRGVDSELSYKGIDVGDLPQEIHDIVSGGIPRVELTRSLTGELQDSVSSSELNTESFEFMQGLFFYAGLNPQDATPLFDQDDATERQIQDASKILDANLRRLWGQGTQLHFSLAHRKGKIEFLADDPAVKKRKARMSKRSDGVTQFFRTSIVLNARRRKHPANSYLYLFDEPGVYLHPQGQKDLMQVFEQLGIENQIVYATHSLFMLNQNFPERHRLVIKDEEGTKIDGKPHRANWRLATDALGVYLTSSILFSSHVLFVEGDSDPLYLFEFFRQMNRLGELDADTNRLGIMSFSDIQNLKFLLQVIKRDDTNNIQAMVLFDGDDAGAGMSEKAKSLCDRLGVKRLQLDKNKSIEDFCFHEPTFIAALTKTLRDAKESDKAKVPTDLDAQVLKAWEERKKPTTEAKSTTKPADQAGQKEEGKPAETKTEKKPDKTGPATAGRWFKEIAIQLIEDEASKVALARNYILACRELEDSVLKQADHLPVKRLCQSIADSLSLPKLASEQVTVANA
jgi:predicted ATP-dependent endonuclease of OLD family